MGPWLGLSWGIIPVASMDEGRRLLLLEDEILFELFLSLFGIFLSLLDAKSKWFSF